MSAEDLDSLGQALSSPESFAHQQLPFGVGQPELDRHFMAEAMRLAAKAFRADEVPVGALIVREGRVIARAHNQVELLKDATAHAEMIAITQAEEAVGNYRLNDCDLYVTKEPCPMCAGALVHVRMRRVIFGCPDERGGAAGGAMNLLQAPTLNHRCDVTGGVSREACAGLLQSFFQAKRRAAARLDSLDAHAASQGFEP